MDIDRHTPTWRAVQRHAEAQIARHLTELEAPLPEVDTARLRGAIWALRALLKAGEPPVVLAQVAPPPQFAASAGY